MDKEDLIDTIQRLGFVLDEVVTDVDAALFGDDLGLTEEQAIAGENIVEVAIDLNDYVMNFLLVVESP